jgi:hypothetical protein
MHRTPVGGIMVMVSTRRGKTRVGKEENFYVGRRREHGIG